MPPLNVVDFHAAVARVRAADEKRLVEERTANRQKRLDAELSGAGIPKRFRMASVSSVGGFCREDVLGYCQGAKSHLDTGAGVFMHGSAGAGKTTTGCAVLNYVGGLGYSVGYRTAHGLVMSYKAAGFEGHQKFIQDCEKPDFMFIDEIDKLSASQWELSVIIEIIDARSRECRPIIVAFNTGYRQIQAILGEPCIDRLAGHGSLVIEFTGDSMR